MRSAVSKLSEDGTLKDVGVGQNVINGLQQLGELLERSKVRPDMKPVGWSGKAGRVLKGATGAGDGLAYLMTRPNELKVAIRVAQGAGVVAANQTAQQATHQYDPSTGRVEPVTP